MIHYKAGDWQLAVICQRRGSVFPKAVVFAIPAAFFAVMLHWTSSQYGIVLADLFDASTSGQIWTGYNFVLSFLLVFRTQNAYARYWEGGTLLTRTSGQWRSAVSSCFAFCSPDPKKAAEVKSFQKRLMQLASLLHCMMLQEVTVLEDENFDVLEMTDLEPGKLRHLMLSEHDKCGMVMQWVQKLIAHAQAQGTLSAPPPIVSRCFQELSHGLISFNEAYKIREIMFPFPYLQVVQTMLLITTLLSPLINVILLDSIGASALMTFVVVAAFWSINYIAAELEMPYGDDPNDLPVRDLQTHFNAYLLMLAQPEMEEAPAPKLTDEPADPANINIVTFNCVERHSLKQHRASVKASIPADLNVGVRKSQGGKDVATTDTVKKNSAKRSSIGGMDMGQDAPVEPSTGTTASPSDPEPVQRSGVSDVAPPKDQIQDAHFQAPSVDVDNVVCNVVSQVMDGFGKRKDKDFEDIVSGLCEPHMLLQGEEQATHSLSASTQRHNSSNRSEST